MLSGLVRILNFDNSLIKQKLLLKKCQPTIIDLTKIGPSCRIWLNKKDSKEIKNILGPELKNAITFLGSGDFHHVSGLLLEQFEEPLTVIVFDHHPDWDILPPRLGYGSWVSYILRRRNIKKIILLGVSSEDISSRSIQTGNLSSLRGGRVEIYPYIHQPTFVLGKKGAENNISVKLQRRLFYQKIYWSELKDMDLTHFFFDVRKRIETKQVYVSIDKDCLTSRYSLTNWEEGCFELNQMLLLLGLIMKNLDVVGVDVVGDYSLPKIKGRIKDFLYHTDHPRDFSARCKSESEINSINEQTNLKILQQLKN